MVNINNVTSPLSVSPTVKMNHVPSCTHLFQFLEGLTSFPASGSLYMKGPHPIFHQGNLHVTSSEKSPLSDLNYLLLLIFSERPHYISLYDLLRAIYLLYDDYLLSTKFHHARTASAMLTTIYTNIYFNRCMYPVIYMYLSCKEIQQFGELLQCSKPNKTDTKG